MSKIFTQKDIQSLERFYRANLINSFTGLKPANLIGTKSEQSNLAIFSSVVHLGSSPALIGFIQRPLTEFSHTYHNICSNPYYTINHVSSALTRKAHQTSAKFDKNESEFECCGLKEQYINAFPAPFVEESPIKIGLKFCEEFHIKHNDTRLIIGEVQLFVIEEDSFLMVDGNLDLEQSQSASVIGLGIYCKNKKLSQYGYIHRGERHM